MELTPAVSRLRPRSPPCWSRRKRPSWRSSIAGSTTGAASACWRSACIGSGTISTCASMVTATGAPRSMSPASRTASSAARRGAYGVAGRPARGAGCAPPCREQSVTEMVPSRLTLILVILASAVALAEESPKERIGAITELRAVAEHLTAGEAEWRHAQPLASLRVGDQLRTSGTGRLVAVFRGASTVVVTPQNSPFLVSETPPPGFIDRAKPLLPDGGARQRKYAPGSNCRQRHGAPRRPWGPGAQIDRCCVVLAQ